MGGGLRGGEHGAGDRRDGTGYGLASMKGLDLSFAKPPLDWWQRRKAEGYRIAFICLWTGGYAGNAGIKAVAETNLRNARLAGLIVAGYANASPPTWWPLATQVAEIRNHA